ncbi:MAG: copper-translocating P-type ATPase [Acidimicrobiales bacterium]
MADTGEHSTQHAQMFRRLFWWNLALSVPVLIFSAQIQEWFGYSIDLRWDSWVAPVFGTLIYVWGGRPFLTGGYDEAKQRQPAMMLLIALAVSVAYGASLASSLGWGDLDFWWELAGLIVVMLLGHWQEMKAIGDARGALHALAEMLPDTAERLEGDDAVEVDIGSLAVGDLVLVRPGGRVPADGSVQQGSASFDESMITGESRPVQRAEGDHVVAGTVSTDSSVQVRIEAVGEDTTLAGIERMVSDAQSSNSRAQALADKAAAALFYVAVSSAAVTMVIWAIVGNAGEGVIRTVTVLVIACPHALGLAIPLVISISTATAAQAGVLVKNRLALERMRTVDAVLFDKTGTLTKGNHAVVECVSADGWDEDRVLALAAAAERQSEHPIALAISDAAHDLGDIPDARQFEAMAGRGVSAMVEGEQVYVGGPALMDELDIEQPSEFEDATRRWSDGGAAVLWVIVAGAAVGALSLADEIRPESHQAVQALHDLGIQVLLITGDAEQVARSVADDLGIDEVFAGVLPDQKDAKVDELQQRGLRVAMVGDGVNDAPALARAELGIAIGAGTDVAIESAGVVLASNDPRGVLSVIMLSRATYRKMVQNLVWASAYNTIAIPVAAGAFAFAGLAMPPALAAVVMSLSTIIVAANAQLLRRIDLGGDSA